jgi:hypothetical protein
MAGAKSAAHRGAADVATAEAASHVAATESAPDVATTEAASAVTATESAASAACESAGGRQRERCCDKRDQGEFFDHDVHPSIGGRPDEQLCARPPDGSGITPC